MLSLYTLKSASDAFQYYQKGDYYTEGGTETASLWFGKGSESLNLTGTVDFKVFKDLLKGRFPDGSSMLQANGNQHHRPGYDLTFSAPKSVSILALIGNNQEILTAYRESVQEVLTKIEEKYGASRRKIKGEIHIEKTGNMVFATFEHVDSRAGDPALHTHSVLMNMTKRADGAWRTLYADEIYNDKLLNGMEQRSILARKLLSLGYDLRFGPKGTFEIEAIPVHLINYYSKRHEAISQWLKDHDLSGGLAASMANFQTRSPKQNMDPMERQARWIQELGEAGFNLEDLEKIAHDAKERGSIELPDLSVLANTTIESAILHLSENQSYFSIPAVLKSAKMMSILPSADGDFLRVIEAKIAEKSLIYVNDKLLTTPQNKALEIQNQVVMQHSQGTISPMMADWIARIVVYFKVKTETQQQTLKFILTSQDAQILVTTNSKPLLQETLKALNGLCMHHHYYPRFLTERVMRVEPLKKKLNTDRVSTIEGFLFSCEKRAEKQNPSLDILSRWTQRVKAREARDIWVVQGDVSFSQVNRLQQWSKLFGSRLIFTQARYQDIPALSSLKEKGIAHYEMVAPQYYQAELKVKDSLLAVFNRLEQEDKIGGILGYQERIEGVVKTALSKSPLPLLVTLTHTERLALNDELRIGLIEKGVLKGNSVRMNPLQVYHLSQAEKSQAHLYQPGDILRFEFEKPGTVIQKDSYVEVGRVHLDSGLIELNTKTDQITWNPTTEQNLKKIEVFRIVERELRVGDTLVWTRTLKHDSDQTLNRIKNQKASVVAVENSLVTASLANGQIIQLDGNQIKEQHWDYGYAVTLKNAILNNQKESVLVLQHSKMDSKSLHAIHDFLEDLKETKKSVTIVCNDVEKVKATIESGGVGNLRDANQQEVPYQRAEALSENQTIPTQLIFHGLQAAYLKVSQLNPEFNPENIVNQQSETVYEPQFRLACDVVDKVCLYHAEREAVLKLKTLKLEAAQLGGLQTPIETIDQAFDLAIEQGWLTVVPGKDDDEVLVVTRDTLLMERRCIELINEGKNQVVPMVNLEAPCLIEIQENPLLTEGQKRAIHLVLTTADRFAAIQGIAGAGKTTALQEMNRHCTALGFKTLVIANTGSAKSQAHHASGIESMTTAQFLTRMETGITTDLEKAQKNYGSNCLIILDEVSLVSTQEMFRLEMVVKKLEGRLQTVGDFKQIGSIGRGDVAHDALAYGIPHVAMTENVRLSDKTAFAAMKSAYAGDMAKTIEILKDRIEEIPNKSEALDHLVDVYCLLTKITDKETVVVVPLNKDREFMNNEIRARFKESQKLVGDPLKTTVLLPTDRREADQTDIFSYKPTDIIRFNTNHPRLGVKSGDYVSVMEIDLRHHRLTLKQTDGKIFYWSPKNLEKPSDIEIYQEGVRELMQQDTIILKRNHEQLGVFNRDRATILKLEEKVITLLFANQKAITFDLAEQKNQHLDYGYALTPHASQGRNIPMVIAYEEGAKPSLKKTIELRVGDNIVLNKGEQGNKMSQVVEVLSIEQNKITVKKDQTVLVVEAHPGGEWEYFRPVEERADRELPLSTSQQSFVVQITRGDCFYCVVPHVKDFQQVLERHERTKQSALSQLDPNWQQLNEGVKRLVANISGRAEGSTEKDITGSVTVSIPSKTLSPHSAKASSRHLQKNKGNFIDQDALNQALERNALGYASQWLGTPTKTTAREARWGSHGSLSVTLAGSKAGFWKNYETGEGGRGLVSLYSAIYGVEWKEALHTLASQCGLKNNIASQRMDLPKRKEERGFDDEKALRDKRIKVAQREYQKTREIKGTLAEKYLREYRGIEGELPTSFRFNPSIKHLDTGKLTPALIAPIHDSNGTMTGIVRIFLNQDGSKLNETYVDLNGEVKKATDKANLGVSSKGSVIVQSGLEAKTLWIAEGVETALSVAKAVPDETVVASLSISQLKNVPVSHKIENVIICADHDPVYSDPNRMDLKKNIIESVEHYLSMGKKVFVAVPPEIPVGMKKCDFNDLMKLEGIDRIKDVLNHRVQVSSSELLKSGETSLSNDLEKISGADKTEVMKQSSFAPSKEGKEIER